MKRERLTHERLRRGWSQAYLSELLGVTPVTISRWERSVADPYPVYVAKMTEIFGMTAVELGLAEEQEQQPGGDHLFEGLMQFLEHQGMDIQRRELLARLVDLMGVAAIGTVLPSGPSIAVEEFLPQCDSALKGCWHLMKGKGLPVAEEMLSHYIPTLTTLTALPGLHQETAAGLATQAKIIQAILAMHRLNLVAREMHCHEAVKYGRMAGDGGLLAAAHMTLAYTYTYCIRRPKKAIQSYLEGLQALGDETSLLRSDLYMGLADAYAQCKEEQEALRAIGLAKEHFPQYPEQDPRFLYADVTVSELHQWEGKMYLDLAKHHPDRGYSQQAYNAFAQSAKLGCIAERSDAETAIFQAEAAQGIGDLEHYTSCLERGTTLALALGSQKRYSEAFEIYNKTPDAWRDEQRVKALKEIFVTTPVRLQ